MGMGKKVLRHSLVYECRRTTLRRGFSGGTRSPALLTTKFLGFHAGLAFGKVDVSTKAGAGLGSKSSVKTASLHSVRVNRVPDVGFECRSPPSSCAAILVSSPGGDGGRPVHGACSLLQECRHTAVPGLDHESDDPLLAVRCLARRKADDENAASRLRARSRPISDEARPFGGRYDFRR